MKLVLKPVGYETIELSHEYTVELANALRGGFKWSGKRPLIHLMSTHFDVNIDTGEDLNATVNNTLRWLDAHGELTHAFLRALMWPGSDTCNNGVLREFTRKIDMLYMSYGLASPGYTTYDDGWLNMLKEQLRLKYGDTPLNNASFARDISRAFEGKTLAQMQVELYLENMAMDPFDLLIMWVGSKDYEFNHDEHYHANTNTLASMIGNQQNW